MEEKKLGDYRSWIHLPSEIAFWALDAMEEAMDTSSEKRRWARREGESSFLCEVRDNEAGRYFRISRVRRGDGPRSYALCIPNGDGNYYWGVLLKEMQRVLKENNQLLEDSLRKHLTDRTFRMFYQRQF